jgi:hypothetical protein
MAKRKLTAVVRIFTLPTKMKVYLSNLLAYYKMPRSKTALVVPAKTTTAVQVVPAQAPPSFMQTIKEGFAFGAGSSIARNVIDRVMSTGQTLPPSRVCHEPCLLERNVFENCIISEDNEAYCGNEQLKLRNCIKNNQVK